MSQFAFPRGVWAAVLEAASPPQASQQAYSLLCFHTRLTL